MGYEPSQKGIILLKDAAASPVEVVACGPRHNCTDLAVVRRDRRGGRHQVRTLESLVHAGLLAPAGLVYVPTERGMSAVAAIAS